MVYFFKSLRALIGVAALAIAAPTFADEPSEVTVTATRTTVECAGLSADEARRLAQQASRDGDHRKAADCFRAAGEHNRADRALIKASADSGAAATRQASANVETAKAQARRIREAFRGT
jgi:hypothetical protein